MDGDRRLSAEPPDFELVLPRKLRRGRGQGAWLVALFGLAMATGAVMGNKTAVIDKLAFGDTLRDLGTGYRMYTSSR